MWWAGGPLLFALLVTPRPGRLRLQGWTLFLFWKIRCEKQRVKGLVGCLRFNTRLFSNPLQILQALKRAHFIVFPVCPWRARHPSHLVANLYVCATVTGCVPVACCVQRDKGGTWMQTIVRTKHSTQIPSCRNAHLACVYMCVCATLQT